MISSLFTIPFQALVRWHTPRRNWQPKFKDLVDSFTSSVQLIYSELANYRNSKNWLLQFNGSRIYMEHYLNDLFDPLIRGVRIENTPIYNPTYLYNKAENRTVYTYNRYDASVTYATGEYCRFGLKIYIALQETTGDTPDVSPAFWSEHSDVLIIKNKGEIAQQIHYRVILPAHVTLTESLKRNVRAAVDVFNVATKNFEIVKE